MYLILIYVCATICVVSPRSLQGPEVLTRPQQIHLSLTGDMSEMMVTWVTVNATGAPMIEFGLAAADHKHRAQLFNNKLDWPRFDQVAVGTSTKFTDGGKLRREMFIHRVKLTGLKPKQSYVYHAGSSLGWSDILFFRTMPQGTNWSPRVAMYGDMGNKNAQSLPRLQQETQRGYFDAIFHIGDFAYDMDTDDARVGDEFMNQIQSVAGYLPYMTAPGNHESKYNFSNYKNRFTMPGGDGESMFYSFNIGPAHVVAFSSEFYYFVQYGFKQIIRQYQWLEQDLKEANKPENRAQRPWIITMCHRPLYCSNKNDPEHCSNMQNHIRTGVNEQYDFSVETLLYKYGVDLHIQAHEHSYERMWPVYNLTVCNGSTSEPYRNPRAPVHIVAGSAGCQELIDPFFSLEPEWSAFHSDDYGYSSMEIINSTHLHLQQISDNKGGAVIDEIMLIKDHHDAYNCHLQNKN